MSLLKTVIIDGRSQEVYERERRERMRTLNGKIAHRNLPSLLCVALGSSDKGSSVCLVR